ncbi:hypothetical protein BC831DRAFT_513972 [Entophlyctis helioformis]|nr:hypothetical protein BC831DRAFT_513972 [Entophlyctis helioformis]
MNTPEASDEDETSKSYTEAAKDALYKVIVILHGDKFSGWKINAPQPPVNPGGVRLQTLLGYVLEENLKIHVANWQHSAGLDKIVIQTFAIKTRNIVRQDLEVATQQLFACNQHYMQVDIPPLAERMIVVLIEERHLWPLICFDKRVKVPTGLDELATGVTFFTDPMKRFLLKDGVECPARKPGCVIKALFTGLSRFKLAAEASKDDRVILGRNFWTDGTNITAVKFVRARPLKIHGPLPSKDKDGNPVLPILNPSPLLNGKMFIKNIKNTDFASRRRTCTVVVVGVDTNVHIPLAVKAVVVVYRVTSDGLVSTEPLEVFSSELGWKKAAFCLYHKIATRFRNKSTAGDVAVREALEKLSVGGLTDAEKARCGDVMNKHFGSEFATRPKSVAKSYATAAMDRFSQSFVNLIRAGVQHAKERLAAHSLPQDDVSAYIGFDGAGWLRNKPGLNTFHEQQFIVNDQFTSRRCGVCLEPLEDCQHTEDKDSHRAIRFKICKYVQSTSDAL